MTQKTLPILGTVCVFSLVFLGFLAGCKEKKENSNTSTLEEKKDDKESEKESENKKNINFEDIKEGETKEGETKENETKEGETKEGEIKDLEHSEKKDHKDGAIKPHHAEKDKEGAKDKENEKKLSHHDAKADRVALVEKTLELMAKSRGSRNSTDVEDVVLA